MAATYRVLGQSAPTSATTTTLYTAPTGTGAVISSLIIANRAAAATTVRVSVHVGGASVAAPNPNQFIAYDTSLGANEVLALTLGASLAATDAIAVYTAGSATFTAFGVENP